MNFINNPNTEYNINNCGEVNPNCGVCIDGGCDSCMETCMDTCIPPDAMCTVCMAGEKNV